MFHCYITVSRAAPITVHPRTSTIQYQSQWVWLIRSSGRRSRPHLASQQSLSQICREKSHLSPERMPGSVKRPRGSVINFSLSTLVFMPASVPGLAHQERQSVDCVSCRVQRGDSSEGVERAHWERCPTPQTRPGKLEIDQTICGGVLAVLASALDFLNKDTDLLSTDVKANFISSSTMRTCTTSHRFFNSLTCAQWCRAFAS